MSTPANSPLTLEHLTQLRNAKDILQNSLNQIELAKRAGIDVSQQEQQVQDALAKIEKIRNVYFPGQ